MLQSLIVKTCPRACSTGAVRMGVLRKVAGRAPCNPQMFRRSPLGLATVLGLQTSQLASPTSHLLTSPPAHLPCRHPIAARHSTTYSSLSHPPPQRTRHPTPPAHPSHPPPQYAWWKLWWKKKGVEFIRKIHTKRSHPNFHQVFHHEMRP